jgi:hypothetical protein
LSSGDSFSASSLVETLPDVLRQHEVDERLLLVGELGGRG